MDHRTLLRRPQKLNTHEPPKMPGLDCQDERVSVLSPNETHNGGLMAAKCITLHGQNLDSHWQAVRPTPPFPQLVPWVVWGFFLGSDLCCPETYPAFPKSPSADLC